MLSRRNDSRQIGLDETGVDKLGIALKLLVTEYIKKVHVVIHARVFTATWGMLLCRHGKKDFLDESRDLRREEHSIKICACVYSIQ